MKAKDLMKIGFEQGPELGIALRLGAKFTAEGLSKTQAIYRLVAVLQNPELYLSDINLGELARALHKVEEYKFKLDQKLNIWGKELIDENTIQQMQKILSLYTRRYL